MNKNEALNRLTSLENEAKELRKIIEAPEEKKKSKEELFIELINGCEIKIDKAKYPNSIFLFKGEEYFFEIEKSKLWCSYKNVWIIFEKEFGMNCNEIQSFIKSMVEEHFKMQGVTPEWNNG